MSIRNIKNQADYDKKVKKLYEQLELKQKLNQKYADAVQESIKNQQLDIKVIPPQQRSLQQQLTDAVYQRQIAFQNLSSIMTNDEVQRVLSNLTEQEIINVNSNFKDILTELKGRTNISASFFKTFLDRYTERLRRTGQTNIVIPSQASDIEALRPLISNIYSQIEPQTQLAQRRLKDLETEREQQRDERETQAMADTIEQIQDMDSLIELSKPFIIQKLYSLALEAQKIDIVNGLLQDYGLPQNYTGDLRVYKPPLEILKEANEIISNNARQGVNQNLYDTVIARFDAFNTEEKLEQIFEYIFTDKEKQDNNLNDYRDITEDLLKAKILKIQKQGMPKSDILLGIEKLKQTKQDIPKASLSKRLSDMQKAQQDAFELAEQGFDADLQTIRQEMQIYRDEQDQESVQIRQIFTVDIPNDEAQVEGIQNNIDRLHDDLQKIQSDFADYQNYESRQDDIQQILKDKKDEHDRTKALIKTKERERSDLEKKNTPKKQKQSGTPQQQQMDAERKQEIRNLNLELSDLVEKREQLGTEYNELVAEYRVLKDDKNLILDKYNVKGLTQFRRILASMVNDIETEITRRDAILKRIKRFNDEIEALNQQRQATFTELGRQAKKIAKYKQKAQKLPVSELKKDIYTDVMADRRQLYGFGYKTSHRIYNPSNRRIIKGHGLLDQPAQQERFINFGKYKLHFPSLKQNILNLKYPSHATIKEIPQRYISDDFKDFLLDIIKNNEYNKKDFDRLEKTEQDLFITITNRAGIIEGFGLQNKNNVSDDLKRFELVKAQIIAGNNSKEVLNECKNFIIQFMKDGRLSYDNGIEILQDLKIMI